MRQTTGSRQQQRRPPPERSFQIYRRYVLDGVSEAVIARELRTGAQRVQSEIARVEQWLAETGGADFDRIRVRHTYRLEAIYHRAMAEFDRSRQESVTNKRTVEGDGHRDHSGENGQKNPVRNPKLKIETVTTPRMGELRFLSEARSALSEIRKIWGADADSRADSKSLDENELAAAMNLESLTDAELDVLRDANRTCERLRSNGSA